MTIRERVLASRLIEKIDSSDIYADQIGLIGTMEHNKNRKGRNVSVENKRKNYSSKREN